jgi:hypothetical protein
MPTTATAYYPYDAGAGANVTEAQWRNFMARLAPSAVLAGANNELAPSGDSTGMQVKVATGAAWVRGAYGEWTSGVTTLPIAAVGGIAGGSSRIDSIVARNDFVNNRVELDVLTGTAGVTPAAPALTQSSSIWEILLGNVGPMTNATTTITAAMVLDGRWKMTPSGVLPTGYRTLRCDFDLRGSDAATQNVYLQYNNDAAVNYKWQELYGTGTANANALSAATATPFMAQALGTGAAAGEATHGEFTIANYSGTTWMKYARIYSTYSSVISLRITFWNQTAALTVLKVGLAAGSFLTDSRFVLRVDP